MPAQEPEPASPAEPSEPAVAAQPADFPDPGAWAQPGPPDTPLDPSAVTGPPWPRLVATTETYTPPRLARWPIIVGVLLTAGWIAALVTLRVGVSSPTSGYVVTVSDARFTATFPARPQRAARTVGTSPVIAYVTTLSSDAVGVTYIRLPASASFNLDDAVNGEVSSLPGAAVVSRNSLTYLGEPAEDAIITFSAGFAEVRIVRFGSSAYVLQGFGSSASSFAHDYNVLIDSFHPLP
jgi:hypothetical protein